ncbi:transmembrane emp24 domain-containing protein p24delta9-like [Andrographis paniculata]|uniref:transmembrane emp24 domain-containing protein p24delta9-like n=1 Tax=Andrographis paniculata TaxID=175694 RepID=UPI0021E89F38|nr:transmembrane emp24 domain-containing protein p24delta9-like [Andrographis paniculata]
MDSQFRRRYLVAVLVSIFLLWSGVESIRFDLESGHTKCISEDIKSNSMTVGKYHVVNPNEGNPLPESHKVTVRVTSPYGNSYHYAEHVTEGHFAYQASEPGDYMACFFAASHQPSIVITVDFEWKSGIAAKDWGSVAKKGSVELMEIELKKMLDTVQSISEEMYYLREREQEMQELNRSTNDKMFWFSFLSILVCLSVAGLQFWHLKSFFEKKKII